MPVLYLPSRSQIKSRLSAEELLQCRSHIVGVISSVHTRVSHGCMGGPPVRGGGPSMPLVTLHVRPTLLLQNICHRRQVGCCASVLCCKGGLLCCASKVGCCAVLPMVALLCFAILCCAVLPARRIGAGANHFMSASSASPPASN